MKKDWTYKKLGEVCSSDLGKTLNSKTDNGEYYPYLCAINVLWDRIDTTVLKTAKFEPSELERYSVKKGDLLVCEGGDVGRAAIWNDETVIQYQNALHRIRFKGEVIPRFCLFYLRHLKDNGTLDAKYAKGVTIKHLVKSSLLSIPIPIPPIKEQEEICSLLDKLSLVIEKKKQQIKELDNLAQAIFYDMFGDPIANTKGWVISTIDNISTDKLSYGSGASAIEYDGQTRYVRITDINDLGDLNEDIKSPSEIDEKYLLREGDILFARSGATVGKTYCHREKNGRCIYAGYLIKMRPDKSKVMPKYVFYYTKSEYYKAFIKNAQNAVAQPNINAKQYGGLAIPVPPLSLQQSFAQKIESIERQKELINQSIREAQTLFNSRMEYYFGE